MARPVAKLRTSVLVAAAGFGLMAATTLAGCGGSTSKTSGSPTTTAPAASTSNTNGSSPRAFPGASGSVAAITGRSMEVQSQQNGQTTVSWTSATTFSETVTVKASSIAVGDCVTASGTSDNGTITAKTVSVSKPKSGSCPAGRAAGFGGGGFGGGAAGGGFGGGHFRGGQGTPPGGSSGSRPSGAKAPKRPAGLADFGFAGGKVTAVSSSKLVLSGFSSSPGTRSNRSTSSSTPKAKTVDVATSSSTTYSQRETVASSKLAVGDCVTAVGQADSTGAVKAKTVQITSTGHKSCTAGFGGFGGFRGGSSSGNSSNG